MRVPSKKSRTFALPAFVVTLLMLSSGTLAGVNIDSTPPDEAQDCSWRDVVRTSPLGVESRRVCVTDEFVQSEADSATRALWVPPATPASTCSYTVMDLDDSTAFVALPCTLDLFCWVSDEFCAAASIAPRTPLGTLEVGDVSVQPGILKHLPVSDDVVGTLLDSPPDPFDVVEALLNSENVYQVRKLAQELASGGYNETVPGLQELFLILTALAELVGVEEIDFEEVDREVGRILERIGDEQIDLDPIVEGLLESLPWRPGQEPPSVNEPIDEAVDTAGSTVPCLASVLADDAGPCIAATRAQAEEDAAVALEQLMQDTEDERERVEEAQAAALRLIGTAPCFSDEGAFSGTTCVGDEIDSVVDTATSVPGIALGVVSYALHIARSIYNSDNSCAATWNYLEDDQPVGGLCDTINPCQFIDGDGSPPDEQILCGVGTPDPEAVACGLYLMIKDQTEPDGRPGPVDNCGGEIGNPVPPQGDPCLDSFTAFEESGTLDATCILYTPLCKANILAAVYIVCQELASACSDNGMAPVVSESSTCDMVPETLVGVGNMMPTYQSTPRASEEAPANTISPQGSQVLETDEADGKWKLTLSPLAEPNGEPEDPEVMEYVTIPALIPDRGIITQPSKYHGTYPAPASGNIVDDPPPDEAEINRARTGCLIGLGLTAVAAMGAVASAGTGPGLVPAGAQYIATAVAAGEACGYYLALLDDVGAYGSRGQYINCWACDSYSEWNGEILDIGVVSVDTNVELKNNAEFLGPVYENEEYKGYYEQKDAYTTMDYDARGAAFASYNSFREIRGPASAAIDVHVPLLTDAMRTGVDTLTYLGRTTLGGLWYNLEERELVLGCTTPCADDAVVKITSDGTGVLSPGEVVTMAFAGDEGGATIHILGLTLSGFTLDGELGGGGLLS